MTLTLSWKYTNLTHVKYINLIVVLFEHLNLDIICDIVYLIIFLSLMNFERKKEKKRL